MKYFLLLCSLVLFLPQFSFASQLGTPPDCDTLIYTSGKKVPVKIQSVSADEIKYKECGNNDSLVYVISSEMINSIQYVKEGKVVVENIQNPKKIEKKYEVYSILSFISPFLVFLPLGFLGLPLAIVLGILGLFRIHKNKDKYKGRGFAIAGIILAPAIVLAYIVFLVLVLMR